MVYFILDSSLILDMVKFILQEHCTCYFFQWIDGPEFYDDYLLSEYVSILLGSKSSETWKRIVRPPPSPPKLWKLGATTPRAPPLVWCEHCQDMTRWCPLYGPNTLDESWKVFDEEQKKIEEEHEVERQAFREKLNENSKKREIEATRKKEEQAREREEKRRKEFDDSKAWLNKTNTKWKVWNR